MVYPVRCLEEIQLLGYAPCASINARPQPRLLVLNSLPGRGPGGPSAETTKVQRVQRPSDVLAAREGYSLGTRNEAARSVTAGCGAMDAIPCSDAPPRSGTFLVGGIAFFLLTAPCV